VIYPAVYLKKIPFHNYVSDYWDHLLGSRLVTLLALVLAVLSLPVLPSQ